MLAKYLQSGSAQASQTYIEDVFSTYLYTGNGGTQSITNGVDLSTYGGLVWIKNRTNANEHVLTDTVRGTGKKLMTNSTGAEVTTSESVATFNSNGFSLNTAGTAVNGSYPYVSWTFRKAAKFFDVVTYTGNGSQGRTISHSLSQAPGMIIVKTLNDVRNWFVWHRSYSDANDFQFLESTAAKMTQAGTGYNLWNGTLPTSTVFTVNGENVSGGFTNVSGVTYVAYLFAHDTSATGLVQCGSYTGNGAAQDISIGFEPQFFLAKRIDAVGDWFLLDNMRGMGSNYLKANTSGVEDTGNTLVIPTPTGLQLTAATNYNQNTGTYIYLAIRRGPMKVPTNGTQVYNAITRTGTGAATMITGVGFPPDLFLPAGRGGQFAQDRPFWDRLRGKDKYMVLWSTGAEQGSGDSVAGDGFLMDGFYVGNNVNQSNTNYSGNTYINYFFRRYPGVFDVVCYTGTGVVRTVSHSLGAVPEIIIGKSRSGAFNWYVYHVGMGATKGLYLNATDASFSGTYMWNDTSPTASVFSLGTGGINVNADTYVAYLFATLAGISKVGSYTGNGSNQTINCGFAAGTRFVLIKRTDSTGDWYVWDSARGIVAANDPHLSLNTTSAEVSGDDSIDPDSSGFIVNQNATTNINVSTATYVYLAIA